MRFVSLCRVAMLAAAGLAGSALIGCGGGTTPDGAGPADGGRATGVVDDHSGWWCYGHAVPEELCAQCNAKVAAEYQKKGDWCEEHNRPESQCFLCDPTRAEKFAAQYEAKFGTRPPDPSAR